MDQFSLKLSSMLLKNYIIGTQWCQEWTDIFESRLLQLIHCGPSMKGWQSDFVTKILEYFHTSLDWVPWELYPPESIRENCKLEVCVDVKTVAFLQHLAEEEINFLCLNITCENLDKEIKQ